MDVIQNAINNKKHITEYRFGKEQTWDNFRKTAAGRDGKRADGAVIDVSRYDDSQELVAACDMLISDYSSIMFEAAVVGKAVLPPSGKLESFAVRVS